MRQLTTCPFVRALFSLSSWLLWWACVVLFSCQSLSSLARCCLNPWLVPLLALLHLLSATCLSLFPLLGLTCFSLLCRFCLPLVVSAPRLVLDCCAALFCRLLSPLLRPNCFVSRFVVPACCAALLLLSLCRFAFRCSAQLTVFKNKISSPFANISVSVFCSILARMRPLFLFVVLVWFWPPIVFSVATLACCFFRCEVSKIVPFRSIPVCSSSLCSCFGVVAVPSEANNGGKPMRSCAGLNTSAFVRLVFRLLLLPVCPRAVTPLLSFSFCSRLSVLALGLGFGNKSS